MFFQKLSADVYVLVNEFNHYPSIGLRKCLLIKKTGKLIIGKEGINLIYPQYKKLKEFFREILSAVISNKELDPKFGDLEFNMKAIVSSSTLFQLKIERNEKSIYLDQSMLKVLQQNFSLNDQEIGKIFESIKEGIFLLPTHKIEK